MAGGDAVLTGEQRAAFWKDGFVFVPDLLTRDEAIKVRDRYEGMFAGSFDTGVYPDEWHWRKGISFPHAVREICNGWKSDLQIQSMVLDERFGRVTCELLQCSSARVAQDSLIWKPPGAGPVTWHQDQPYISSQFEPAADNSITIWCALDDADEETGVLEYARASHLWTKKKTQAGAGFSAGGGFHGNDDSGYMAPLHRASKAAGVEQAELDVVRFRVPIGSALIHHQGTWHGSGSNTSPSRPRRALAVHMLRGDVRFVQRPTYIYGRYKLGNDTTVHETFFPTTYTKTLVDQWSSE
eukprot:Tamp_24878.p1 GENE.Tamp_24878~~Tamp_24878.p1  ORF type:complete len:305 (-),score=49.53 Tamp_24878:52-942(-)